MEKLVRPHISKEKNQQKMRKDAILKGIFRIAAVISGGAIAVIVLFVFLRGVQPFLPGYANGQVNFIDFLFGTTWRQDQGVYGAGFIIINTLITALGGESIYFMVEPEWFRTLFITTDIWQHAGWNTILYIATLTGIDPGLYEAATIDGATKLQKIRHIEIPHLIPIAVMMLILNCGSLLASNTDKALLMQTSGNMATSDIIGVYVYQMGLGKAQFSYTTAIGLMTNVINFVMIIAVNWIAKRLNDTSLF